jgi:hypothetical protein
MCTRILKPNTLFPLIRHYSGGYPSYNGIRLYIFYYASPHTNSAVIAYS